MAEYEPDSTAMVTWAGESALDLARYSSSISSGSEAARPRYLVTHFWRRGVRITREAELDVDQAGSGARKTKDSFPR